MTTHVTESGPKRPGSGVRSRSGKDFDDAGLGRVSSRWMDGGRGTAGMAQIGLV
jgi:hypothetical protein